MSKEQILAKLAANQITVAEASKLLADLEPKNVGRLYCKVGDKGTISLYGLMVRFPVSLYVGQWQRLFDYVDEIKAFIKANENHPAVKAAAEAKEAKKAAA